MGDWGRGGRLKCNQLQYNRSPKGCRMQEGDAGTKSLYIPPIRPLSRKWGFGDFRFTSDVRTFLSLLFAGAAERACSEELYADSRESI
jgi:hypothetical protein